MPAKKVTKKEAVDSTYYVKRNMISFGNFLLSKERKSDSDGVTDSDFQNWIATQIKYGKA